MVSRIELLIQITRPAEQEIPLSNVIPLLLPQIRLNDQDPHPSSVCKDKSARRTSTTKTSTTFDIEATPMNARSRGQFWGP